MTGLLFQQTAGSAYLPQPWPVALDADGTIRAGRPDAATLIGFQRDADVQTVDLLAADAVADPDKAVGMFPVYAGTDGGIFVVTQPVVSAREWGVPA